MIDDDPAAGKAFDHAIVHQPDCTGSHAGPDGVTCVVTDETHQGIYHGGRPVPGYTS